MVLHGLKRIFQKPTPDLSSSDRTNQLRSKTLYAGTVELSTTLDKPGNNRYKTYNGPFEIAKKNVYGDATLVASTSYKDLLDITKGKVLLNQLPLTDLTYTYYEKNFGNGEMYVGNYQQFDGTYGPTGCVNSVLVYDMSSTGLTGPGSYTGNSIGYTGPTGTLGSNQDIFIDPKHCYYSDPCDSSASYMNFVDIDFKGPTGATGATGITGPSQYFAQQIINANQYSGFRFPMSNFTLTCKQQIDSQAEGPLFCPSVFVPIPPVPPVPPGPVPNSLTVTEFIIGENYSINSMGEYTVYRFFPTTTTTGTVTPNAAFHVDYLIVGGGGAGGTPASQFVGAQGGGGGAGGLIAGTGLPLTAITYPLQVGGGGVISGVSPNDYGTQGDNSQFHTFIAVGGGNGGNKADNGGSGGSGGGAASTYSVGTGTLNGGASTINQGFLGGNNPEPRATLDYSSAGGGGAGGPGYDNNNNNGSGGVGLSNTIFTGSPIYYAGGGGGSFLQGSSSNNSGNGGGGSGAIFNSSGVTVSQATNGINGLGGGGGGGSGLGGSGVVILRFLSYPP